MFILASKHRAVVAELERQMGNLRFDAMLAREMAKGAEYRETQARKEYHELAQMVASYADRALPPPRKTDVKQPLSIDKADGAVVKRLKESGGKA